MSRKKYAIIILLFAILVIPFSIYIDNTKFEHTGIILVHCLYSFICFYLYVKKAIIFSLV